MAEPAIFLLAVLWVFGVPGVAVLSLLPEAQRPRGEFAWVYALGLGLSINPLLYMFRDMLGVTAGTGTASKVAAFFAAVLVVRVFAGFKWQDWRLRVDRRAVGMGLAVLAVGVGTFGLRWISLHDQPVPPGADSAGHALRGLAFLESGGVPSENFVYHFGVHANSAALSSTSGLPIHRVQLLLEPFLMAMVAVAMVVLAWRLTASFYSALATGVVVGFLSIFPAYYMIWGRQTMLGGTALLPLVLAEIMPEGGPNTRDDRYRLVESLRPGVWVLASGLMITHYRIGALVAFAAATLVLLQALREPALRPVWSEIKRLGLLLVPAALIVGPWVIRVLGRVPADEQGSLGTGITTGRYPPQFYDFGNLRGLLDAPPTVPFLLLTVVGILSVATRPDRRLLFIPAWLLLTLAFTDPYRLPLPGAGVVYEAAYVSAAAIVGSVFGGVLLGRLARGDRSGQPRRRQTVRFAAAALAVAAVGSWLSVDLLETRPFEIYVRDGDLEAFRWINDHLPGDARFLIATAVASNTGRPTPVDGGEWIEYFTGTRNQLRDPELRAEQPAMQGAIASDGVVAALRQDGVTHVYLGTSGYRLIDRGQLESSGDYRQVFTQGEAAIYELVP